MFGAIRNGMQELIKMKVKEMSKNLFMMAGFVRKQKQKLSHTWWYKRKPYVFHVEHNISYRPKYTNKTLMSAGETPLIRDAWEMVTGRMDSNFSLASNDRDFSWE